MAVRRRNARVKRTTNVARAIKRERSFESSHEAKIDAIEPARSVSCMRCVGCARGINEKMNGPLRNDMNDERRNGECQSGFSDAAEWKIEPRVPNITLHPVCFLS
jgi:hypothetical protein